MPKSGKKNKSVYRNGKIYIYIKRKDNKKY